MSIYLNTNNKLNEVEEKAMKLIATLLTLILITACQSEVDKCVSSQIDARSKFDDIAIKYGGKNADGTEIKTKEKVEAEARLECMKALNKN
jgi:hypothetical protein